MTEPIRVPLGSSNRVTLIDPADAITAVQYRWYRNTNGYAVTYLARDDGGRYAVGMHRILMGLQRGDGLEVDHINLDRLDNRRCNLRVVTRPQNDQNRPSAHGDTSKYRNVSWARNLSLWRACITVDGKQIGLGHYADELEAARAAEAGRRTHMPFAIPRLDLEPKAPCACAQCRVARRVAA